MKEYTGSRITKQKRQYYNRAELEKYFLNKPFALYDNKFIELLNRKGLTVEGRTFRSDGNASYTLKDKFTGGQYVFEVETNYMDWNKRSFVRRILM